MRRGSYNVVKLSQWQCILFQRFAPWFQLLCLCLCLWWALKSTSQWLPLALLPFGVIQTQPPATPSSRGQPSSYFIPTSSILSPLNFELLEDKKKVSLIFISWTQSRVSTKQQRTKENLSIIVNSLGMDIGWGISQLSLINVRYYLLQHAFHQYYQVSLCPGIEITGPSIMKLILQIESQTLIRW